MTPAQPGQVRGRFPSSVHCTFARLGERGRQPSEAVGTAESPGTLADFTEESLLSGARGLCVLKSGLWGSLTAGCPEKQGRGDTQERISEKLESYSFYLEQRCLHVVGRQQLASGLQVGR